MQQSIKTVIKKRGPRASNVHEKEDREGEVKTGAVKTAVLK